MVYGHLPVMLSSQCLKKTLGRCDHKEGRVVLSDRYRNEFFCDNICGECTNVIYNPVPLFLDEKELIGEGRKKGLLSELLPSSLRVGFTKEKPDQIVNIIKYYVNILQSFCHPEGDRGEARESIPIPLEVGKYTRGHLNRGVE